MCFSRYISRGTWETSQLTRANPEAITEFRRNCAHTKLTKGPGGPHLSRAVCPILNVAGVANCVTAIRTEWNEIRRIACIVGLCLSETLAPCDLFRLAADGTIESPQGKLQGEKSTPRYWGLQSLEDDCTFFERRMLRRNIRNNAPAVNWF